MHGRQKMWDRAVSFCGPVFYHFKVHFSAYGVVFQCFHISAVIRDVNQILHVSLALCREILN